MHLWVQLQRLTTPLRRREEWISLGTWVLAVALLETAGPLSPTDAIDGLLLAGVLALALGTLRAHAIYRLRWVAALRRGVRTVASRMRGLDAQLGVDCRRTPPLRRGTPRAIWTATLVAVMALTAAGLVAAGLPEDLRVLSRYAYLPYLLLLGLLWSALGAGIVMGVMLPIATLHDRATGLKPVRARRRRVALQALGLLAAGLLAASLLPAWVAAWAAALVFGVTTVAVCVSPVRYGFIWLDPQGERRSLSWRRFNFLGSLVLGSAALTPLLVGLGDEVFHTAATETSLPMTRMVARAFAWTLLSLSLTLLFQLGGFLRLAVAFEVARRARPTLRIEGAATAADWAAVRALGWRPAGRRARPGEVRVCVEEGADPGDGLFGPTLPAAVPPGWLADPQSAGRLARRRVEDLRQRVQRGVIRALDGLVSRRFERGTGFWIAPHLWFARGLTRDQGEGENRDGDPIIEERLGRPWEGRMTWAARAYLFEVLAELEIDLIFVQDGVSPRRLTRVLRALFEVRDTYGPCRLEERHLALVPGVRALIQDDAGADTALSRTGFPEPDYRDVGRARLLLVFHDHGDHEEGARVPADWSHLPAPTPL